MPLVLVAYYCALILIASIIGGMIPVWFQLTHRWMQFAVSFVAGVMLGVAVLHMLPHAIVDAVAAVRAAMPNELPTAADAAVLDLRTAARTMTALLTGMLVMFFIERFFSFHHHDVPSEHRHDHEPHLPGHQQHHVEHTHDLSWSGAALGLALHSILNGVALAAAVQHGGDGSWLAGLGTFLVIFLHKPFDAMTIGMLMARGGRSLAWRHTINALFSLAIPLGALLFYFGLMTETSDAGSSTGRLWVAYALAFSAGTFLCISLSDLLPELQFHQHDRGKLSIALLLGLAVAYAASQMEAAAHASHVHAKLVGKLLTPPDYALLNSQLRSFARFASPSPVAVPSSPDARTSDKDGRWDSAHQANFMTSNNYRTWQKHHVGHLLLTVQLDPVADSHNVEQHNGLADVTTRLIGLMNAHRLPATWAVSDPAYSAATSLIIRSDVDHELAILGDANWVGPTAGRTRFARELARRVSQARGAGIEVKTLVPRVASVQRHIDLVIKQRITAIGGIEGPAASSRQIAIPRALHYGVWELPTAKSLPIQRSNWMFRSGWSTWRQIRRAANSAATYHLVIDAPALLNDARRAEKTIAWLMRRAAELRNRGLIQVETLSAAAARLSEVPALSPQRSILRRAA